MRNWISGLALALMALAWTGGAASAGTVSLSTAWTLIATAGNTVQVQLPVGSPSALLATATGGAPTDLTGFPINPGDHPTLILTQDLYARSGQAATVPSSISVLSGFTTSPFSGGMVGPSNPLAIGPAPVTLTATEVAVSSAASTQILAANASRRFARVTNDGTGSCRVSYGTAATASTGEPVAGAAAQYGQGGGITFDASGLTLQAVFAYCPSASSFAVVEGQ